MLRSLAEAPLRRFLVIRLKFGFSLNASLSGAPFLDRRICGLSKRPQFPKNLEWLVIRLSFHRVSANSGHGSNVRFRTRCQSRVLALAKKAAESLELQVLKIEIAEQIELARLLPSSEILAPSPGHMPVVRKELFDKLLALVPTPVSRPSKEAASAAEVDAATSVAATDNLEPASKAPPPRRPPTTWVETGQ